MRIYQVPKIKPVESLRYEKWLMITLVILYFSSPIASFLNNKAVLYIYCILYYLGSFVMAEIITFKERKKSYRCFKKRIKQYVVFFIIETLILVSSTVLLSLLSGILLGRVSNNEVEIRRLPVTLLLVGSVIFAPVVEETVYRYALRRIISNDQVFIVASGVVFGVIHTISSFSEFRFTEWTVLTSPYIVLGLVLGYVYACTNSIEIIIINHRTINVLASITICLSLMKY